MLQQRTARTCALCAQQHVRKVVQHFEIARAKQRQRTRQRERETVAAKTAAGCTCAELPEGNR